MKPRTRIRSVSKLQARRLRLYAVIRKTYLLEHPLCERCKGWATEIHHSRGKVSELLFATQFFIATCADCHRWIHDHPAKARELLLLCEEGKWNSMPKDL
jgi:hypothetical protein